MPGASWSSLTRAGERSADEELCLGRPSPTVILATRIYSFPSTPKVGVCPSRPGLACTSQRARIPREHEGRDWLIGCRSPGVHHTHVVGVARARCSRLIGGAWTHSTSARVPFHRGSQFTLQTSLLILGLDLKPRLGIVSLESIDMKGPPAPVTRPRQSIPRFLQTCRRVPVARLEQCYDPEDLTEFTKGTNERSNE